jgi:hypothetical protein
MTDVDITLEIYDLALSRGKKPGEDIQKEFEEVLKNKPDRFTFLGNIGEDMDIDLLVGNLRERGLKILNLKEIERRMK